MQAPIISQVHDAVVVRQSADPFFDFPVCVIFWVVYRRAYGTIDIINVALAKKDIVFAVRYQLFGVKVEDAVVYGHKVLGLCAEYTPAFSREDRFHFVDSPPCDFRHIFVAQAPYPVP